jgi:hypothetical protein
MRRDDEEAGITTFKPDFHDETLSSISRDASQYWKTATDAGSGNSILFYLHNPKTFLGFHA